MNKPVNILVADNDAIVFRAAGWLFVLERDGQHASLDAGGCL